jgi:hypothetical protein
MCFFPSAAYRLVDKLFNVRLPQDNFLRGACARIRVGPFPGEEQTVCKLVSDDGTSTGHIEVVTKSAEEVLIRVREIAPERCASRASGYTCTAWSALVLVQGSA